MTTKQKWKIVFSLYRTAKRELIPMNYVAAVDAVRAFTGKLPLPDIVPGYEKGKKDFPYVPRRKFTLWMQGKWDADCAHYKRIQEGKSFPL
jgi:hypothetical protein